MSKKTKIVIISSVVAVILVSIITALFFINKNNENKQEKEYIPESNVLIESYTEFSKNTNITFQNLAQNVSKDSTSSMAVEDFYSLDMYIFPMIICGTDKNKLADVELFYSNIDCKYNGANDYTITAKDKNGKKATFEIEYDKETDSAKIKTYIENRINLVYEYVKIDDKYAVQYSVAKDNKYNIGKLLYSEDGSVIKMGTYEEREQLPKEIYKNVSIINDNWIENGNVIIEHKEGQTSSVVNGERVDLNQ